MRHSLKRMDHLDHYALKRDTVERICTKEIIYAITVFLNIPIIIILGLCGFTEKYNRPY